VVRSSCCAVINCHQSGVRNTPEQNFMIRGDVEQKIKAIVICDESCRAICPSAVNVSTSNAMASNALQFVSLSDLRNRQATLWIMAG
jgi:hypothetical protein